MKFNKPINIQINPEYAIKEECTEEDMILLRETSDNLGGITAEPNYIEDDSGEKKIVRSGGRFDWGLYTNPHYQNATTTIQLMRLWTCQMVTQMVNNKAYVNEIGDEPKFNITDEEKEVFFGVISRLIDGLNDCLEKSGESMVMNKKIKKVEL